MTRLLQTPGLKEVAIFAVLPAVLLAVAPKWLIVGYGWFLLVLLAIEGARNLCLSGQRLLRRNARKGGSQAVTRGPKRVHEVFRPSDELHPTIKDCWILRREHFTDPAGD